MFKEVHKVSMAAQNLDLFGVSGFLHDLHNFEMR